MKMKYAFIAVALATCGLATTASAVTLVNANSSIVTNLGFFSAGSYHIAGSGVVDLVGPVGSGFDMQANGIPFVPVTFFPYNTYFNPNGSNISDGNYGPGGPGILLGALMGTLNATPTTSDWFLIGYGTNISLSLAGNIYAQVNDNYYWNNGGAFSVSVSSTPLPSTWLMLLSSFVGLGFFAYRGTKKRSAALAVA